MPSTKRDPDSASKHHPLRNALIVSAILLLVICLYAFRAPILTGVGDYLIVSDRLQPADVIFVLNSEVNVRPFYATDLYQQGLAPFIAIARSENSPVVKLGLVPNDTDIDVRVMEKLGVPASKIVILPFPGGVTSTFDEADALRQYIETKGIQRVIVVTSAFHTRRARWILDRQLAGLPVILEMAPAPYPNFDQTTWWQDENGLITVNNEYVKLVYYLFKYH